jgi:hypothetical protein
MINKGNVSLRQAREDCGISGSGGMRNVTEFVDRHGSSGYSLKQLGGHVLCFSSKVVTGSFPRNVNPAGSCRRNYAEANVYSPTNSHNVVLENPGPPSAQSSTGRAEYISMGGWSYMGTIPPGSKTYKYSFGFRGTSTGTAMNMELIGWPDGFFAGTPTYYQTARTTHEQSPRWVDIVLDGSATPYITLCLTALGSNYLGKMNVLGAAIKL